MRLKRNHCTMYGGQCIAHGEVKCACGFTLSARECSTARLQWIEPCIHQGTAKELFNKLVSDAQSYQAEDPGRLAWALKRIAKEQKMELNDVAILFHQAVATEGPGATGWDRMPGTALDAAKLTAGN